jgi:hypothetical protein
MQLNNRLSCSNANQTNPQIANEIAQDKETLDTIQARDVEIEISSLIKRRD